MKKLILFVLSLASLAFSQITTTPQVAAHIIYGTSTPATCKPTSGDIFFVVSGGGLGPYYCSATNTWSAMGSGAGGTITIAGTGNQITATGTACTAGGSGTCTISIPTSPTLPGTTTGSFSGSLNGVTISGTPSTGQVPTATSASTATWQTLGSTTTVSPTFTAIADGTCQSQAATWTGVSAGSALSIGPPAGFADGLQASVKVSATDTVTIKICNLSGASVTPGSQSFTLAYGIGALGSVPGTGTVTSVATTGPISGGTITGAGTISCPTCVTGVASTSIDILSPDKPAGTIGCSAKKNLSVNNGVTVDLLGSSVASSGCADTGVSGGILSGAGYISEIFLATNQYASEIIVTVDGEGAPSIDMNWPSMLGNDYADTSPSSSNRWIDIRSFTVGQVGGTFRLPIPFATSVRIQFKNNSGSTANITGYIVYHTGVANTWSRTQHLYAVHVSSAGIAANVETNMVNVNPGKRGRAVGFGWLYDGFPGTATPRDAPLEGAFKLYVDGASSPNIGTSGTEDIFGDPWYFVHTAAFGATSSAILAPQSADISLTIQNTNTWGAQRFFIQDPLYFDSGIKASWTCGNTGAVAFTGTCTLGSTFYYYTEN